MNKHDWMKSTLSGRRCFICNMFYESDEYGLPKSVFIRFTILKSCVYLCPKLYINTRLICTYIYADEPSFLISNRYSPFAPNTTHWRLKRYFYENWWGKDDESWLNLFDLDTQTLQKISNYILDYENRNI